MDKIVTDLAVNSGGLIGAAGDFSNKVKGLIRGKTLDGATKEALHKDIQDVYTFAAQLISILELTVEK